MQSEKCIPIKKRLVEYMCKWYPDFLFQGGTSQSYAFRRDNPDGIYDHIIIQREFLREQFPLLSRKPPHATTSHGRESHGLPSAMVQI